MNRRATGRFFHRYLNPEREIDEGARAVHGLTRERLEDEPRFAAIAPELRAFIEGAELIIHNAPFDVGFLDARVRAARRRDAGHRCARCAPSSTRCSWPVRATRASATTSMRSRKRYGIDISHRELHGALLDARILADVYLAMTGGQSALALDEASRERAAARAQETAAGLRPALPLIVIAPNAEESAAHAELQQLLDSASGGKCLWRTLSD